MRQKPNRSTQRTVLPTALLLAALMVAFGQAKSRNLAKSEVLHDKPYTSHFENVMGTSLEIKAVAASHEQGEIAEEAVLAEIRRETAILSSWDPHSEFSRWYLTQGKPVKISPELFEVLRLFDQWRERTHGAVDASAETITQVWQRAAAQQRVPSRSELDAAVRMVRQTHWQLDPVHQTATHTSGAPLGMNSFVKSYICGHAAQRGLDASGAQAIVVNIGGDLVVRGDWSEWVNVADPQSDAENGNSMALLSIRDRAVATSGDYRRGVQIAAHHYSHIVDPRTGLPADQVISSTVIARDPAQAGALATALSVLTPEESALLVAKMPAVDFLIVTRAGERIASRGWARYAAPAKRDSSWTETAPHIQPVSTQGQGTWDPSYKLDISVELKLAEGLRIKRPYLAVWIEDGAHAPVRTIAVWYSKIKHLHELFAWTRAESTRSPSEDNQIMASVSSATRPPGKYSFTWDGKDDSGRAVKAGRYTVMIEVSREHGTYQLIHQELDFNGSPKQLQLPGGTEIASASLDYHKIVQ
jgi:thiamine biosynthesis lipoprotein